MSGSIRLSGALGLAVSGGGLRYPSARYALALSKGHYEIAGRARKSLGGIAEFSFARASTATFVGSDGLIQTAASGVARFGYDPVTLAPIGLFMEGGRTTIAPYTTTFDIAQWNRFDCALAANSTVAPDGASTAAKITPNAGAVTLANLSISPTLTDSTVYTGSVFLKKNGYDWSKIVIRSKDSGTESGAWFNLNTGAIGTVESGITATIEAFGSGWYRCAVSKNAGTGATGPRFRIISTNANGVVAFTADGTSGLYAWGPQLEAGLGASSYIPNATVLPVARVADAASMTIVGAYPLGLTVGWRRSLDAGAEQIIAQLDAGDDTQRAYASVDSSDLFAGTTSGSGISTVAGATVVGTDYKGSIRIATNNVQTARGGTLGTADTSATNPTNPTRLVIGGASSSGSPLFGYIGLILVNVGEPTDAQLQGRST